MTHRAQFHIVRSVRIIALICTIATLYFARGVLLPAALAVLLTVMLHPVVIRLERIGLNRIASSILTVAAAALVFASLGMLVGKQIVDLSMRLPDYGDNLRNKIHDLRESGGPRLSRISNTFRELSAEISGEQPATQPARAQATQSRVVSDPVKVEVVNDGPGFGDIAANLAGPVMAPITEAGITLLLLAFLLIHSDDLRARIVSYSGTRQISLTASAMTEIADRIGRYLRMQLLVNLTYGVMVFVSLYFLGIPKALLWGVMGFALRFIPYLGPWVAGLLPTLLTLAIFPGWKLVLEVIAMFAIIESIANMVLEPWLYGASSGLTSLGVICASVFWAWIWGPVGLLLAVPMTTCLVVVGKYVPQLALLHHLFGTDADVPMVAQLYQALLNADPTATDRLMESELHDKRLEQVCDELLLPLLSEMKRDIATGSVDPAHARHAMETLELVVSDEESPKVPTRGAVRIICRPVHGEVDACAARLLVTACRSRGIQAEFLSAQALVSEAIEYVEHGEATHFVAVQVHPVSVPHSRRLIKSFCARLNESIKLIDLRVGMAGTLNDEVPDDGSAIRHEELLAAIVNHLVEQASVPASAAIQNAPRAAAG